MRLVPFADGTQQLLRRFEPHLALLDLGPAADLKRAVQDGWQRSIRQPFEMRRTPPLALHPV
ncbi:hypothetical protein [Roseateles sp.]|uniref:hypothetical protein n=1 Tax=Roseateles sp. TaxID=1971397 RepID=UPI00286CA01D|nr:hypothetical protein [Roseateles sp.]